MMRAAALLLGAALLGGCATRGPGADAARVDEARLAQGVVVGQSSKAQVLAAFGPTTTQRFDSGYEVWLYRYRPPRLFASDDADGEFVILFDPAGIVKKTRRRAPLPVARR